MSSRKGLVFDIHDFSIHDGPGARTVVFLKGCPLRCQWCSNPESQASHPQILYHQARCQKCGRCVALCPTQSPVLKNDSIQLNQTACLQCAGKPCVSQCPFLALECVGKSWTTDDLITRLISQKPFYKNTGGGATLSGGEPFFQPEFVEELLHKAHTANITLGVETCGFFDWEKVEHFIGELDFFLFDIKTLDEAKHRAFTSQSNKTIINNFEKLAKLCPQKMTLVFTTIPGFNDTANDLDAVHAFAKQHHISNIKRLMYHGLGVDKYQKLGRTDYWTVPDPE